MHLRSRSRVEPGRGMPNVTLACTEPDALRVLPLALDAYEEMRTRSWPFLSDVLERALRGVSEADGASVTALAQALVKYDRLLAFATQSQGGRDRVDALLALARGDGADLDARLDRIEHPTERLGVTFSFPDWLVEIVGAELGERTVEAALTRMNAQAPRVGRVNSIKVTREDLLRSLADEGAVARATVHSQLGIVFEGARSPFRTAAFARGDFELQDEASQLVADLVAPPPRSFVVDACAGAGGKTLALAARLQGRGQVLGLDVSDRKLAELRRRARRAGATNVRAVSVDLLDPDGERSRFGRPVGAARVLLDAPCSGLGAIRRNPELRWRLSPPDMARLVQVQGALMHAAADWVAPHGRLVFATCSFLPSEGERAVDRFLREHPDFGAVSARDVLGRARTDAIASRDGWYLRTWLFDGAADGGDDGMDGFFAAVVRRVKAT